MVQSRRETEVVNARAPAATCLSASVGPTLKQIRSEISRNWEDMTAIRERENLIGFVGGTSSCVER